MKYYFLILFSMSAFGACFENRPESKDTTSKKPTQVDRQVDMSSNIDTIESEDDTHLLKQKYISDYPTVVTFDTLFNLTDGTNASIHTKYYCLFDSGLTVPAHYVSEDTTKPFITHNFAYDIRISVNNRIIFNRTIKKLDFQSIIWPQLNEYGALIGPYFYHYDSIRHVFEFGFSITIPVTDVGSGVSLFVDEKGNSWVAHN